MKWPYALPSLPVWMSSVVAAPAGQKWRRVVHTHESGFDIQSAASWLSPGQMHATSPLFKAFAFVSKGGPEQKQGGKVLEGNGCVL